MLQINQTLKQERFRVTNHINSGLSGLTYEAFDNVLKINVFLKEIAPKSNEYLTPAQSDAQKVSLADEAKILVEIKHSSILRIHDYFSEGDNYYLVAEAVQGTTINELLRRGSKEFTLKNVLRWADELTNAIVYLHSLFTPLVHGNVKPENIILTTDGKIKLLPFGITPITETRKESLLTRQIFDAAHLHYSPLEQIWMGLDPASRKVILNNYDENSARILERPLDARTDIYALGATIYHLLTKILPIDPLERSIDMLEGKNDSLPAPKTLNATVPPGISDALLKAMQIKRENRFDSAASMQKILKAELLKIQTQESLKAAKEKEEEDLLEISVAMPKVQKPEAVTQVKKNPEVDAEQKRQFELIKKQLQEAEAQRLKAEQRAIEAERLLLEKEKETEIQSPVVEIPVIEVPADKPTVESSPVIELQQPLFEVPQNSEKTEPAKPNPTTAGASNKESDDDFQLMFSEMPKNNGGFRKVAIGAIILGVFGAAGWGVFNLTKTKAGESIESNQAVSYEAIKPAGETPQPSADQSALPQPTAENLSENQLPVTNPTSLPTEPAAVNEQPASPQIRNKPVASSVQRFPKQTATPPKIAAAEKKPVTVDDIINDN